MRLNKELKDPYPYKLLKVMRDGNLSLVDTSKSSDRLIRMQTNFKATKPEERYEVVEVSYRLIKL